MEKKDLKRVSEMAPLRRATNPISDINRRRFDISPGVTSLAILSFRPREKREKEAKEFKL